ncbi:MAG: sulfur carrier protein ThiS [Pseudomonadota bacterium]
MTITISLNGESRNVAHGTSITDLLSQLDVDSSLVAIAINQVFVPRDQHAQHIIQDNDTIDALSPVQGG